MSVYIYIYTYVCVCMYTHIYTRIYIYTYRVHPILLQSIDVLFTRARCFIHLCSRASIGPVAGAAASTMNSSHAERSFASKIDFVFC